MKPRLILVSLGLALLSLYAIGISAQEQAKTVQEKDDIITSEQQLLRQFGDFQDLLLRLKQKLARGTPEERRRAEVLGKVLDECRNLAINQEFTKIIEMMRKSKLEKTSDLDDLHRQSDKIATDLAKILDMLRDSRGDRLSEERKALEQFIKDLQRAIDKQQDTRGLTDLGKTKHGELAKIQDATTKQTAKIEQDIKKYLDKDNKTGGEAKPTQGDNKGGGKEDGKKGEAKDAGQKGGEGAKGEAKDGGKESQGAKGEAKDGEQKAGDGEQKAGSKAGEKGAEGAKPGSKGSEGAKGKEGDAKGGEGAKGKEGGAKDAGGKGGDPMKGDGQQGAAKGGDDKKAGGGEKGKPDSAAKPGQPGGDKQAGAKDSKGDPKAGGDAKAGGDPKAGAGEAKQGEAKSGESKSGQGQAKEGGMPGAGEPKPGGGGQAKDGPPKSGPPPGGNKQDDDIAKAAKKIQEAGYPQTEAAKKIAEKDNKGASNDQGDAIKKLEEAKKNLEKLLRQMREEEIERVLAALEARCTKMLAMQMQVLAGTIDTDLAIKKNADKKADRLNKIASLKLADNEKEIVQEVNKCIDILESEGSAVAFPEVFQQLRQDMIHVQKRLEVTDVHDLTQNIEKDIITTLKEMIDALKKAQEDNKSDSKPGKSGKSGKPGDQKLLELIQELKMVRALQKRVNDRTIDYAKRFPGQEQTADPQIVRELRALAERQQRIQSIVERIAKGDNK